jgi:hypothetical protein
MSPSDTLNEAWLFFARNAQATIALFALGLTIYQASLARRHSRLTVKPHLSVKADLRYDATLNSSIVKITLTNNGLGPAVIDRLSLKLSTAFELPNTPTV